MLLVVLTFCLSLLAFELSAYVVCVVASLPHSGSLSTGEGGGEAAHKWEPYRNHSGTMREVFRLNKERSFCFLSAKLLQIMEIANISFKFLEKIGISEIL